MRGAGSRSARVTRLPCPWRARTENPAVPGRPTLLSAPRWDPKTLKTGRRALLPAHAGPLALLAGVPEGVRVFVYVRASVYLCLCVACLAVHVLTHQPAH